MKKKILFIISNMQTGGVSKSMTSLMNVIDRERYDVSLMIVSPHGPFMELLPKDLRIISNPVWSALQGRLDGTWRLLKMGRPLLAIGNLLRLAVSVFNKAYAGRMIAALMPRLDEEFDTIVDFNGQQQLYYMVDKMRAHKKLSFFHSDYKKWPYYYSADKKYFNRVHSVWTISEQCVNSLIEVFPEHSDKIRMMENILSQTLIERLSNHETPDEIDSTQPVILTIGHLCKNKGTHWAIEVCSILKKRGLSFRWYFIGANPEGDRFKNMVRELDVDDRVAFLGVRVNPYPYIKAATIVVHPSQYEGKSIALDETKLLCKPVVVTNFSTVKDQFTDGHNATICEMTPESIADAVAILLNDEPLRQRYASNLLAERHDNTFEIQKLYDVFDE